MFSSAASAPPPHRSAGRNKIRPPQGPSESEPNMTLRILRPGRLRYLRDALSVHLLYVHCK